jgi:hypothetical protein
MTSLCLAMTLLLAAGCGGDDDGDDDGTADAGAEAISCTTYCATIKTNCTGANAQYMSDVHCMASCEALPVGVAGTTAGNSQQCRGYHANAAAGSAANAELHCVHAGPGGAGACGTNCEGFCAIALEECTGATEAFDDAAECATACATFDTAEKYDIGDTSGNTFACRLYHLTVATELPMPHCAHITTLSTMGTCGIGSPP